MAQRRPGEYDLSVHAFSLPPAPLRQDPHGIVRVASTRVTLDSVVALFDRGATAEEIAQSFPSLGLGEVYATLTYVVGRRGEVDAYLARRGPEEAEAERTSERRSPAADLRARLVARRSGAPG